MTPTKATQLIRGHVVWRHSLQAYPASYWREWNAGLAEMALAYIDIARWTQ